MGLDMYLMGRKHLRFVTDDGALIARQEDGYPISVIEIDLGYWRKHANLHGYIVNTFAGGEDNCQRIELDVEDLHRIAEAVTSRSLPHTEGFFFGKSDGTDEEIAEDLEIIKKAIDWLLLDTKDGWRSVYYQASW